MKKINGWTESSTAAEHHEEERRSFFLFFLKLQHVHVEEENTHIDNASTQYCTVVQSVHIIFI